MAKGKKSTKVLVPYRGTPEGKKEAEEECTEADRIVEKILSEQRTLTPELRKRIAECLKQLS